MKEFKFAKIGYSLINQTPHITNEKDRKEILEDCGYNTNLIPQEYVYIDLQTDSGTASINKNQLVSMVSALGNEEFFPSDKLEKTFKKYSGYKYVISVSQGRAAEYVLSKLIVKQGDFIPTNIPFPTTQFHLQTNGGKPIIAIVDDAFDLKSDKRFKGNLNLRKVKQILQNYSNKRQFLYLELCNNACGGQPVSIRNLRHLREIADNYGIKIILDACRIVDNAYQIRMYEKGYAHKPLKEIVKEICLYSDGATLSAAKDFLVNGGGFLAFNDELLYRQALDIVALYGLRLLEPLRTILTYSIPEILENDFYIHQRVAQVHYLWSRLKEINIPLIHPPGGHAVFIDVKNFLPHISSDKFPVKSLLSFLYLISGIRGAEHLLLNPKSGMNYELLRLAIPIGKYSKEHMDDIVEAFNLIAKNIHKVKGVRKIKQPGGIVGSLQAHFKIL